MRNEIIFKNGRRVFTDADITPKVLTELQTQFESEVTEVNRKPVSKHSVLKAKAGTKTPSKPKKTNPNAISWESFEEKYKPQINHILKQQYPKDDPTGLTGWGGIMYETYGDEYEYIREMAQKHPNRVWTLVDGDDGELVIIAGWHYVNRMNYVITEKPWNTGDEYVDDEMAKHGAKINYIKKWAVHYIDVYKKKKKIVVELGRMSNKYDVQQALKRRGDVLEVLSISELYKYGSMVPDNHEWVELENLYTNFETEQELWEIWSLKQRYHFLKDHFRVEMSKAKDQNELQKFEWQIEDTARLDYDKLPELVKMELKDHKFSGQYKTGGPVKTFHDGEKVKVNGKNAEIVRYDKESGSYVVYTGKYESEFIQPENITKIAKHGAMIDKSQTDLFDKSGVKYRVEVGGIGENRWSGNAMEYDTEDEAKDWLRGLASRWFGYNISRVVPVNVPTNQDIDLSDPLMFQNYRKNAKGTKIRTNSVAVKELIKDLENTPYGVGLALLRERLLTHADYDLKKHKKNPKTFENPIFSVGMYEDLFKRIHKELNFDVSKNNVKAVKDLIKDLANTPHEVGLGLLRERMVAYAENDLEVLKDNPKVFDNPIYNSGMYKDLFNRMIKFCDFNMGKKGMKTGTINVAFYKYGEYQNDEQMELIDLPLTKLTSEMLEGFNIRPEDEDKHFYAEENDIDDTDVDDGGYGIKRAYATTEEHPEKKPMIDIGSDNIAKRGAKTLGDNTRYPRKADDTGKGIMEGWVIGDGNAYYEKEENALKSVKELGYKTIEEAYDNDEIYFTDWHDEDLDEQGYYYTANGKEVQISSKQSKYANGGGVIDDNWEMLKDEVSDEGSVGRILKNGKVVGQYEFDRMSDAFWIDPGRDKGQMSFDTKAELIDYYKNNKFANGGSIEKENADMVLNNNKQISHHTEELANAIKGKSVPAWVVAKVNRSATDLSDATHYLEGTEKAKRGAKTDDIGIIGADIFRLKTIKGFYYDIVSKGQDKEGKFRLLSTDKNGRKFKPFTYLSDRTFANENWDEIKFNELPTYLQKDYFENWNHFILEKVGITEKAKNGTKTGSKGFMVFNYTDDIYASPDTFPTKAKANEFIAQFRKRFEGQGYYRDNRMNKVAPKDIDLLAIPEEFNPYKKN